MILSDVKAMNWRHGMNLDVLDLIKESSVNIAFADRNIQSMKKDIENLLSLDFEFVSQGDMKTILSELNEQFKFDNYPQIMADIINLLMRFKDVSEVKEFKLSLTTVSTNMCRRFHVDVNHLRLLCTYEGPGTLWLEDDNVNRTALNNFEDNDQIILDPERIRQVSTGAVIILKGEKYANDGITGAVHKSPAIEESGETRLILRIDSL